MGLHVLVLRFRFFGGVLRAFIEIHGRLPHLFSFYAIWVAFHLKSMMIDPMLAIGNLADVLGRADAWVTRLIVLR